jgi:hypothetical protein
MASVQEITKTAANGIAVSFQEASAKTKAALRGISDDVKQAANNVSEESLRVAEATKVQAAAFADLRRAMTVTKDANVDAAASARLLAAVQQRVSAAAAEVAAAKKAEAAAVAEAAEEEALSQNVIVRAFQKAALEVSELSEEIRERAVEAAESGGLAEGGAGGFAGLGTLLGVGIAGGFATHFLDEIAKVNVELDHLSVESGLSVESLAGLQQIVKEMGGEWDPIATGLIRFNRAQAEAATGSIQYKRAFDELGISLDQLKDKTPEEKLGIVSRAFAGLSDQTKVADAAITLFGRGGIALVPVLKEQGAALEANIKSTAELTGITEQSAQQARRWTADMAHLSAEFRSVLIPIMEHADPVIRSVAVAFEAVAATIVAAAEGVATAIVAMGSALRSIGVLVRDVIRGDWTALVADAAAAKDQFVNIWKAGGNEIRADFKVVADDAAKIHWNAQPVPEAAEVGEPGEAGGGAGRGGKAAAATGLPTKPQLDTQMADIKEAEQEFIEGLKEQLSAAKDAAKQEVEAYREARDEEIHMAQERFKDLEQDTAAEVRLHQLSASERINILRNAANQEYAIELQALRAKEQVDLNDAQKYQQDLNRELELTREHNRQIAQLNQQAAEQSQKAWMQAYDKMSSEINRAITGWITEHQSFARSMAQILNGITQNFITNVLKMTEQYLLGLLIQKAGQKSQIEADAKTAAANAYTAVSAIPVVGPFLAPAAAAGAFAAVLAFESFNEGGVVQGGNGMHIPILAKQGERVLTPSQTQNFETLVSNSSASTRSSHTVNLGGVEQHFHDAQVTPRQMQRSINDAVRRGRLRTT